MVKPRRLIRASLFAAAAAAMIGAAIQLREQRITVTNTAKDIEDQLSALDPVTRAAVVARLTADATNDVKSGLSHH